MATEPDEGWMRYPEAKVRMPEGKLKVLIDGLTEDGFCSGAMPRIQLLDDGVYIEVLLNVGKHGNVIALPFEVFIPVSAKQLEKFKPKPKKKSKNETEPVEVEPTAPVVELHSDDPGTPEGTA
jgi:hypothetical protein